MSKKNNDNPAAAKKEEKKDLPVQAEYYGGKWGVYLRAPDLWFDIIDKYGELFSPLGDIAEVRFGVKSGKDVFFFPKDISTACLEKRPNPMDFEMAYHVSRKTVESGKIRLVSCGQSYSEIKPIESEYLAPEVHTLMEIDGFVVEPEDCKHCILLVDKAKTALKGSYVLEYIKWGEKNNYHKGSTCASRVTDTREWYDLTGHKNGALFWAMAQQYKHVVPANSRDLVCNHNLFDITPREGSSELLGGILNSSLVVLAKHQYGRPVGVEGNLKTEVVDVKMMLVPDPSKCKGKATERIEKAFNNMKERKALQFLSERRLREMAYRSQGKISQLEKLPQITELDLPDRQELDDAILELIGIGSREERQKTANDLHEYLREMFERIRQKEEKAIQNKKKASRRVITNPRDIAYQIFSEIEDKYSYIEKQYDTDFLNKSLPFDTYEIPNDGAPAARSDLIDGNVVDFIKGKKQLGMVRVINSAQAELIATIVRSGLHGLIRVPHLEDECTRVRDKYLKFVKERDKILDQLIEERTSDEEMQDKIREALISFILHGSA